MALTKKLFKTTFWGQDLPGYYYVPSDKSKKYPAFAFFPGLGALGSPEALFAEGMLKFIEAGFQPPFIAIGIFSGKSEPIDSELVKYVIENDTDIKPVFNGQFAWTGLSKGGFRVLEAMSRNYPGVFIPMSSAAQGQPIDFTIKHPTWAFHSENDTNPGTPYSISKNLVDSLNARFPESARLTTTHSGHGGWDDLYNPAYRDPVFGTNIYDWALQVLGGAVPVDPEKPVKKLLSTYSLKLYDDGSADFKQV